MVARWLLLRGLGRGNVHWGQFPEILRERSNDPEIELIELAGNGVRFAEASPMTMTSAIEDLRSQSAFCNAGQRFHLVGISLGGMIALSWATLHPEDLESISVINTSTPQLSPPWRRLLPKAAATLMKAIVAQDRRTREARILSIVSNNFRVSSHHLDHFAQFSYDHPISLTNLWRQLSLARDTRLSGVPSVPIKVIVSANDRLVHPSCSYELAKFLRVRPLIHDHAGHDLPLDAPDWLAQALKT